MMNLFIVTFYDDLTQFIIDTSNHDKPEAYALQRAIEVNLLPDLGAINDKEMEADIKNPNLYEVELADMQTLANKIRGNAIDGVYGGLFGDTIVIHN